MPSRRPPSCGRVWLALAAVAVGAATMHCGRALDLGNDVIWSTDFESGNLSAWSEGPGFGGQTMGDAAPSYGHVDVTDDAAAHSGRHAARLSSIANFQFPGAGVNGVGLVKEGPFPQGAYYSAWYYIPGPGPYNTISGWNIFELNVPNDVVVPNDGGADGDVIADAQPLSDAAPPTHLLDLSLESMPPSEKLALVLSDARHAYLTNAFPATVPAVPIGRWFQLECYYNNTPTSDGELRVWLDGQEVYDIHRPMSTNAWVAFVPCSLVDDVVVGDGGSAGADASPELVIYIDDVAISWSRVGPDGLLGAIP